MVNARFPEDVAVTVGELVKLIEKQKLAVFYGAGISINPPSNLPSGAMLRKTIVKKLIDVDLLEDETRIRLEEGVVKREHVVYNKFGELHYPFEAFIQTLDSNAPIIDTILEIYSKGEPNKNHILLAELIKKGYLKNVLTTNFEVKIEEALERPCLSGDKIWKREVDFKIFSNEFEFLSTDFLSLKIPIILKIHGTIEDKDSIRATLEAVSRRELREARSRVLLYFFQKAKHDILIVGYSVSDDFDINPVLRSLKSDNRIFLIKHSRAGAKQGIYPLEDPFKNFKGDIICYDTDEIINYIWNIFVGKTWEEHQASKDWKNEIEDWSKGLHEGSRLFLAAQILHDIQEYMWAEKLYMQSLKYFERLGDQIRIAYPIYHLAKILQIRGNYDEAEKLYKQTLEIVRKINDYPRIVDSLHQIATIHYLKGNYDDALNLYMESIEIKERIRDHSGIAASLHQVARIWQRRGNYSRAEKLYEKSLKISRRIGDLKGIAKSLHQLAIIQQTRANYDEAKKLYKQSLKIVERLGEQAEIASSLHQLANIQYIKGNFDEAKKLYIQSLEICRKLEYQLGIAFNFSSLGLLLDKLEELDSAITYYEKAYELFRTIGHNEYERKAKRELDRIRSKLRKKEKTK